MVPSTLNQSSKIIQKELCRPRHSVALKNFNPTVPFVAMCSTRRLSFLPMCHYGRLRVQVRDFYKRVTLKRPLTNFRSFNVASFLPECVIMAHQEYVTFANERRWKTDALLRRQWRIYCLLVTWLKKRSVPYTPWQTAAISSPICSSHSFLTDVRNLHSSTLCQMALCLNSET